MNQDIYYDAVILEDTKSKEDVIGRLSDYLLAKGYVNEQYKAATLEREGLYPTGLATKPVGVAVPHSTAENVIKPAVLLGIARDFIPFTEMGNCEASVDVGIIFMLALQSENNHMNYLKNIVNFCRNEQNVLRLHQAKNSQEASQIFHAEILGSR